MRRRRIDDAGHFARLVSGLSSGCGEIRSSWSFSDVLWKARSPSGTRERMMQVRVLGASVTVVHVSPRG